MIQASTYEAHLVSLGKEGGGEGRKEGGREGRGGREEGGGGEEGGNEGGMGVGGGEGGRGERRREGGREGGGEEHRVEEVEDKTHRHMYMYVDCTRETTDYNPCRLREVDSG